MSLLTEVDDVLTRVTAWAATRPDVVGLLLVGSYARDAARPDSDVDIVLLTTDPAGYVEAWPDDLPVGEPVRTQRWGVITERRFRTRTGLEVEFGIGTPAWAATAPVDPGTHRVVTDGARPLHDPAGLLSTLLRACRLESS